MLEKKTLQWNDFLMRWQTFRWYKNKWETCNIYFTTKTIYMYDDDGLYGDIHYLFW